MPEGVTELKACVFSACRSLERVSLPSTLRIIGEFAFVGCESLREIAIPDGVTEIARHAFSGCRFLHKVLLPAAWKSSKKQGMLKNAGIPADICVFRAPEEWEELEDGTPAETAPEASPAEVPVSRAPEEREGLKDGILRIPDGTAAIPKDAFRGREDIRLAVLPEGVAEIGESAFWGCKNLQAIALPESLRKIGRYAFGECAALETLRLPEGLEEIGLFAFFECAALREVSLPKKWKKRTVRIDWNVALEMALVPRRVRVYRKK